MMHAMKRWSHEISLDNRHRRDEIGVKPQLVDLQTGADHEEHYRRDAEQRQRQIPNPVIEDSERAEPYSHRHVHRFGGMMQLVRCPQQVHPVREAMKEIVHRLVHKDSKDPGRDAVAWQRQQRCVLPDVDVQNKKREADEHHRELLQYANSQVGHRIALGISSSQKHAHHHFKQRKRKE